MNKKAIKEFAISARRQLREDIAAKMNLIGITEEEILESVENISDSTVQYFDTGSNHLYSISGKEIKQREDLVKAIRDYEKESDYQTAYDKILEEVAYTWFNRLIAIRFMEINDYLPSRMRIVSSEDGLSEPEILRNPFDANIDYTDSEIEKIRKLQDENRLEDLFKFLFIKQCNELNQILPFLFEETDDYSELLFPLGYTSNEGVVSKLISHISEENFDINLGGQIEIIGWLYQFYNSELKDETFALLNKSKKINKENLPSATQLFTPDWIVKYMVENSIGRIWINHLRAQDRSLTEEELSKKFDWKYFIPEAEQNEEAMTLLNNQLSDIVDLSPQEISVLDPAMGSGHILVYAFEVLMQIYESEGFSKREAAVEILNNNLYGLDIDKRATQLAYFAILMKAREYNRRIFKKNLNPNLYTFIDSSEYLNNFLLSIKDKFNDKIKFDQIQALLKQFENGKLLGSLIKVNSNINYRELLEYFTFISNNLSDLIRLSKVNNIVKIKYILEIASILEKKYEVVITNPPYLGNKRFNSIINDYLKKNYPDSKSDLYLAFLEKGLNWTINNGYLAMITMNSWMFLSGSEKLRKKVLEPTIVNMLHLGTRAFEEIGGEVVQTTAFIIKNTSLSRYKGTYYRLVDILDKESAFLSKENVFKADQSKFIKIPGSPIAYWVSNALFSAFENGVPLGEIADSKQGLATADNNSFLRLWFEVNQNNIKYNAHNSKEALESNLKWFPYNKGGEFRKWYGNNDYVVNWENNGWEIKNFKDNNGKQRSVIRNPGFYFQPSVTWSLVSSGAAAFRYKPPGSIFDVGGMSFFTPTDYLYLLAYANSPVSKAGLEVIAPTINYQCGDIAKLPVIKDESSRKFIECLAQENINLSQQDWDSFEFSWDFKKHPLIRNTSTIKNAFEEWKEEAKERFNRLKANEEELNRIFIDIYGMQDELTPEVEDKYVSVRKADLEREIKSLISYAVGCILGRYSLDQDGLAFAGGEWDSSKYKSFIPDSDNVIPIIDTNYFEDDIVGLFVDWLKVVYGEETLEENLDFIAEELGKGKNKTSRDVIRDYFSKDFIKDHNKIYQKRPIYWLYDSGRNNGFKALVYMHRYDEDTTGRVAADYLNRMIKTYHNEIARMEHIIDNSDNKNEINKAKDRKKELSKQLKECQEYDDRISHLANMRIPIDLDDGVKVNHEKIQTDENGNNLKILSKI